MHIIDDFLEHPYIEREYAIRNHKENSPIKGVTYTKGGLKGMPCISEFYRLTLKGEEALFIHTDAPVSRTTVILYLNTPTQCLGGTAFYRHLPTGLEALPPDASPELMARLARDGHDRSKWVVTEACNMAWNRLLAFDSARFHAPFPATGWGDSPETGRLIQAWWLAEPLAIVKGHLA